MPSAGQTKRISRIHRRAVPAVRQAYERGDISARMADTLLYLPVSEQALELERRLSAAHQCEARHRAAAQAIRGYLDSLNGRQVDLHQLSGIIRQELS